MHARPAIEKSEVAIQTQAKITAWDTRYALEIVKRICALVGPGLAGSTHAPGDHLGALRLGALSTANPILRYRKSSEGSLIRAAGIPRYVRNDRK